MSMSLDQMNKFIEKMKNLNGEELIKKIGNTTLNVAERLIKENTPTRTGNLKKAWRFKQESVGNLKISNSVKYASYVEYGHRVRGSKYLNSKKTKNINLKRGGNLKKGGVKMSKGSSSKIFKSVNKYVEPRYMMTNAVNKIKEDMFVIVDDVIDSYFK